MTSPEAPSGDQVEHDRYNLDLRTGVIAPAVTTIQAKGLLFVP